MDWTRYQSLTEDMNWGDQSLLAPDFIQELDQYLSYLKARFFISCATGGKHAEHSLHYSGRAVDVLFVDPYPGHLFDAFICAFRFRFTEVGVYPKWKFNSQEVGGLHLGMVKHTVNESPRRKLWIGIPGSGSAQVYIGASAKNLIAHNLFKGV
jgi:hypothetical protein